MTINLYTNNSPKNQITKDLTLLQTLQSVTLKAPTDIINPVFVVSTVSAANIMAGNYCSAPELGGRSYFINDIVSVKNGVYELHCHVDVLTTYAEGILEQEAIVHRQENAWNLYLDDGIFKTYQNPHIITKAFPSGFSTQNFVLAVAGD